MELLISGITTLFSAGAGAAGAAGAATGLAGALSAGSAISSVLSGGVTVLSALRSMQAGKEKAQEVEFKAFETGQKIADEREAGVRRRTGLKEDLFKVLGQNDVNVASAGLDLSYGFGKDLRENTTSKGVNELQVDRQTEESRVDQLKLQQANYQRMARGYRSGGNLSAALTLAEGGAKLIGRYG